MEYKIFSDKKPSEEIEDIVISGGTPVTDCDHCGRVHYDSCGEYMNEGELEELERKHRENPEKYCPRDGTVHHGVIGGGTTVAGCPCNILSFYESTFWNNRYIISQYLKMRTEKNLKRSEADHRDSVELESSIS